MSIDASVVCGYGIWLDREELCDFFGVEYDEDIDFGGLSDKDYYVQAAGSYFSGDVWYNVFIRDEDPVMLVINIEKMKIRILSTLRKCMEIKLIKDVLWH